MCFKYEFTDFYILWQNGFVLVDNSTLLIQPVTTEPDSYMEQGVLHMVQRVSASTIHTGNSVSKFYKSKNSVCNSSSHELQPSSTSKEIFTKNNSSSYYLMVIHSHPIQINVKSFPCSTFVFISTSPVRLVHC